MYSREEKISSVLEICRLTVIQLNQARMAERKERIE